MEWKKVKTILIVLLLLTNAILGANIYFQLSENRHAERQSVLSATKIIADSGVTADPEIFMEMPPRASVLSVIRDEKNERALAVSLIGECSVSTPGGGIAIYESQRGSVNLRRGGQMEIKIFSVPKQDSALEYFKSLFAESPINLKKALLTEGAKGVEIKQRRDDGTLIFNTGLSCNIIGDTAVVTGGWLLEGKTEKTGEALTRAAIILATGKASENGKQFTTINGAEFGYYADNARAYNAALIPCWRLATDGGYVTISAIDGQILG